MAKAIKRYLSPQVRNQSQDSVILACKKYKKLNKFPHSRCLNISNFS